MAWQPGAIIKGVSENAWPLENGMALRRIQQQQALAFNGAGGGWPACQWQSKMRTGAQHLSMYGSSGISSATPAGVSISRQLAKAGSARWRKPAAKAQQLSSAAAWLSCQLGGMALRGGAILWRKAAYLSRPAWRLENSFNGNILRRSGKAAAANSGAWRASKLARAGGGARAKR